MKKVSIVLPVYNGAEHVGESIGSILEQSYQNIELIVVDDCSTDDTPKVIKTFMEQDARVKYIRNEINQKLPESLNIGFAQAKGEYYTWTSDDNRYRSNAIAEMVAYMEQDAQTGMVYCDYTIIDEAGKEKRENILEDPERLIWTNAVGACFLYRREVAEKVGRYDKGMFLAEDYDYWLRISQVSKLTHLNKNLYYYRQHGKSLTATRKEQIRHQTVLLWFVHWEFIFKKLKGIKTKFRYCDMILNMEGEKYREETLRELKRRVPLYGIYKAMGKGVKIG